MSNTDKERILLLENQHTTVMENINDIKKDNKEIKESIQDVNLTLAKLPETLTKYFDDRYANKETELNLKRATWLLVSTVLISIISIVIKTQ